MWAFFRAPPLAENADLFSEQKGGPDGGYETGSMRYLVFKLWIFYGIGGKTRTVII
jgi:hypothetical protein